MMLLWAGETARSATMERLSIPGWYRILLVRHEWTILQSIRYALWLLH
jgi:hypothetical protein